MEEILKNIESEINFIKEQQKELDVLTKNSKEVQDELKNLEKERDSIIDKESGFYKDSQNKVVEKENEFRQANIKRMTKDREMDKLVLEKKQSIIEKLEEKKKYIDENRNVDLKSKKEEAEKLQKQKKDLEDIVERDVKNGVSDNDQIQQFRRKKINELNSKIEEVEKFESLLDGKEPKDRFMQIEDLIKTVEEKFNRNGLDEVLKTIGNKTEKNVEEAKEEKVEKEKSNKKSNKKTEEKAKEGKVEEQVDEQTNGQTNNQINKKTGKNNIVLDISANKINVNEKEELFYKEEAKNKQNIIREYGIGSIFLNDKKAKKNIDYALISTLEKIDKSLVEAYLKVIRDGKSQSKEVKECLEKINNAVDITYKFDKEDGIFRNLREKRIARNAKKIGIASLDGISEKSIFDKIKESFSKFGNKLLNGKEKPKELTSGENTISQATLENEENTITQDQKEQGIRKSLKVDNKDNRIERNAQEKQNETQEQIGKEVQAMMGQEK